MSTVDMPTHVIYYSLIENNEEKIMREVLEIVFFSKRQRLELVQEQNRMFAVLKIVDGKEQFLYTNRNFEAVQKFYNKKIGAR